MTNPNNPNASENLLVCGVCEYGTQTPSEFADHVQKSHRRELFFWCRWCGTLFSDRSKYTSHEIGNECTRKYQFNHTCGFEGCGYSTGSPTRFVEHIQLKHGCESFIPCAFCKRSFTIPPCLVEHIQIDCCERPPRGSYKKGPDNNWDSDTENDAQRNIRVHAKSSYPCQVPPKPVIPSTPVAPASTPRSSPLSSHEKAYPPGSSSSFQASALPTNNINESIPIVCSRDYVNSTGGNVPHGQTARKTVKALLNTYHRKQSERVISDSGSSSSSQASVQPTNKSNKCIPVASSGDSVSPTGGNVSHVPVTGKTAKTLQNTARSKQSDIVISDSDPDDPSYNPLEDATVNKRRSVIKTRTSVGPQRKNHNLYVKSKSSLIFCDNCCVPFYDKLKHMDHVNSNSCTKSHKYTYPCGFNKCKYSTTYPNSFLTHLSDVHSNEQFLPCYNCERTFSIKRCLIEHIHEECSVYVKVATDKRPEAVPAHIGKRKAQIGNRSILKSTQKKAVEVVLPDSEPEDLICDVFDDGVNDSPPSSPDPTPVSLQPAGDKTSTSGSKLQGVFSNPGSVPDSSAQIVVPVTRQPLMKETINVEPNVNIDLEILGDIGEPINVPDFNPVSTPENDTIMMPDFSPISNVETKPKEFRAAKILSRISSNILTPEKDTKHVPTFDKSIETWSAWLTKFFNIKSREEVLVFQNSENIQNFFKCMARVCHYTCHDRLNFTMHIITSHKDKVLTCCYCLSSFTNMDRYLEHMVDEHGQLNFQCSACPYRASSKEHVRQHYKCAHANMDITIISCPPVTCSESSVCITIELHKTYNCSWSNCSFRTLVKTDFVTHWLEHHPGSNFFGCGYCNYEATNLAMLMQHYSEHRMFTFECDYCPFGSDTENQVIEHICVKHANHKFQMLSRQPEQTFRNMLLRKSNSPLLSERVSSTTSPKRTDLEAQKEKELSSRPSLSSAKAQQDPSSRAADTQLRNTIICVNTSTSNVPQPSKPFPIGMNMSSFASSLPDDQHQIVSSNSVLPMVAKIKQEPVADTETITGDIDENLPCLSPVYDRTQNIPVQNTIQNVPVQVGLQIAPLSLMVQSTPPQYMFQNSQFQYVLQSTPVSSISHTTQSQYILQNTPRQANFQNTSAQNTNQNMPVQHAAENKLIQQMVQSKPVQPTVQNRPVQTKAQKQPIQQMVQNRLVQQVSLNKPVHVVQDRPAQPTVQNKPAQPTVDKRPLQQMALNKPVQQMVQNQPMPETLQVISTPENLKDTLATLAENFPNVPVEVLEFQDSSYNAPIQIALEKSVENMPVLKKMLQRQNTSPSETIQNASVQEQFHNTPVPEKLQKSPVSKSLQNTSAPERLQNTPALKTLHNTQAPETLRSRPAPETLQNKPAPVTFQSKPDSELSQNMPEALRNTPVPEMLQRALTSELLQTMSVPEKIQTTTAPKLLQNTSAPETSQNPSLPVAEKLRNVPLPVLEVAQNKNCFDISDLKKILENVQQQITNNHHPNPQETNLGSNKSDNAGDKQQVPKPMAISETAQTDVAAGKASEPVSKNSQNSYVCLLCQKAHNSRLTAEAHAQNVHNLKDLYKCSVCSFTSPNNFILKHHIKASHPGAVVSHINLAFKSTKPKKKKTINTVLKEDSPLKIPVKIEAVETKETGQSVKSNSDDMLGTSSSFEMNSKTGPLHRRTGIYRFQCNLCSFHCDSKQIDVIHHLASAHNVQTLYKCALCEFQAVASQAVKKHFQMKHPGGPKKEPISLMYNKTFIPNPISSTSSHDPLMTSPKRSESLTITSPIFIRSSPRSSSSTRTSPVGHPYDNSPKSSSVITTASASPGSTSNIVSYECVFCNYSTSEKSHMVTHLYMEMHYFKYVCVYCNFRGRYPMDVIAHCKRNHSDKPEDVDTKSNSLVEEWVENYVSAQKQKFDGENVLEPCILDAHLEQNYCNMCQTRFPSESLLQEHLFAHLQYRPYRCAICEKSFSINKEVELHQIAHHNGHVKGSQRKAIKVLEEWIRSLIAQNGCFPNKTLISKDACTASAGICVKKEPLEEQDSIEGTNLSVPNETISKDVLKVSQTLHLAKNTELTQKRSDKEEKQTQKSDLKKTPQVESVSNKSPSEKQANSINRNQKTEEKTLKEASNAGSILESKVAQKRKGKINTSRRETVSVKTKEQEHDVDHSFPSSSRRLSTDEKVSSKKNEKIVVKRPTVEVRDLPANSKTSYRVVKGSALKVKIKKERPESLDFTGPKSSCESSYLSSTSKENPKKRKLKALEGEDIKVVHKEDVDLSKRIKETVDIDLIAKRLIKFTNKTARKSASNKVVSNCVQATSSKFNVSTSPKITNYFKATARKSTSKPPQTKPLPAFLKQTARKSVPGHCQTQPLYYSRYGYKPKKPDFTRLFIMTKPPGSQVGVRLSAFYLRDLFKKELRVRLLDCRKEIWKFI